MTDFIKKLESKENLMFEESKVLFSNIMEGKYDENSIIKCVHTVGIHLLTRKPAKSSDARNAYHTCAVK